MHDGPRPVQQPVPIYMAINPNGARVDAASTDRMLRRVTAHASGTAKRDVGRA
jgi:hypothetical protein